MIHVQGIDISDIVSGLSKVKDAYIGAMHIWPSEIKIIGYGEWSINLTLDTYSFPSSGGEYLFKAIALRDIYWSDGSTTKDIITDGTLFAWSITGDGFTIDPSNGMVSVTTNYNPTARSGLVTVSYEGATDTATVSLAGGEEVITYSDWVVTLTSDPTIGNASEFDVELTSTASRTKTTTINGTVVSTETEYKQPTITVTIGTLHEGTYVGNVLKCLYTIPANEDASSREIIVQSHYGDVLTTCTITLNGLSSLNVIPVNLVWTESEWGPKEVTVASNDDWTLTVI